MYQGVFNIFQNLRRLGFFFLFMGAVFYIAAINTYRETRGDVPVVTSEAQLRIFYGESVYIDAQIENTGIYESFTRRVNRPALDPRFSPYETTVWHLYLIRFEDAYVALRSRNNNLDLSGNLYVRVLTDDNISEELLRMYFSTDEGLSQYAAIFSYRNLALHTFLLATAVTAVGIIILFLWRKKRVRNNITGDWFNQNQNLGAPPQTPQTFEKI